MLAARDQENLVHAHQTTAAGKPLNQGIRALQPKTPGNNLKTPFRASRNDENRPFGGNGQKSVLGNGPSKLDKNAFVTPAGPRNRAPLGAKTTNAKAQPLKTPGAVQKTVQKDKSANKPSTARRSGRSKIQVAIEPSQTNILEQTVDDDEPDFGYAPPPIVELPDPPIDLGCDEIFSRLKPQDITRGYGEIYFNSPKDESGMSLRLKREEQEYKKWQEEQDREITKQIENRKYARLPDSDDEDKTVDKKPQKKTANVTPVESNVDSVKARSAATALSGSSFRLPSATTKQTTSSAMKRSKPVSTTSTTGRVNVPHSVSKNTIGFPKARRPPSIIPVAEEDDLADDLFDTDFFAAAGEDNDNDEDVFQLPMPED